MTVNYTGFTLTKNPIDGWATGQTRYYQYADAVSCQTAQATFLALTDTQKVALTTANPPVVPAGNGPWTVRDCTTVAGSPAGSSPPAAEGASDITLAGVDYLGTPFTITTAPANLTA